MVDSFYMEIIDRVLKLPFSLKMTKMLPAFYTANGSLSLSWDSKIYDDIFYYSFELFLYTGNPDLGINRIIWLTWKLY